MAVREENAVVGRARKRATYGTRRVVIRPRGDGEEEEDEKEGGVGKTSCRLHLVSMGGGVPTAFKYPVCRIHQHKTKRLCTRRHIIQAIGSSSLQKEKDFVARYIPKTSPTIYGNYEEVY
jgi:hypothetical protein